MNKEELNNRRLGALSGINPYSDKFDKKEEFILSNKRKITIVQKGSETLRGEHYSYDEEDMKEFIKRLKEEIRRQEDMMFSIIRTSKVEDIIDTLVGKMLI